MVGTSASERVVATPAACMRRKREALYAADFVQCKFNIPASFRKRLSDYKSAYKMRGVEQVVMAMLDKAMTNYTIEEMRVPPPPSDGTSAKQIAIHLPREQHAFLEAIAHRNRGVTLGVALETVGAYVSELTPSPQQLPLIGEGDAVSG